jgi:hypothetical protein
MGTLASEPTSSSAAISSLLLSAYRAKRKNLYIERKEEKQKDVTYKKKVKVDGG